MEEKIYNTGKNKARYRLDPVGLTIWIHGIKPAFTCFRLIKYISLSGKMQVSEKLIKIGSHPKKLVVFFKVLLATPCSLRL